jgi:septal ring factor EnvC (AmiA/AmiB activator)
MTGTTPSAARLLSLALLAAASLFCTPTGVAADRPLQEAKLEKLRATIAKVRKDLDRTHDRYDRTRQEIRDAEQRVAALGKSLRDINRKMDDQRERVAQMEARRTELNSSVAHQRSQLARQVRAAYATGQQEYLRLLLNQEDPVAVGRMVVYYDYFNRARAGRIGALQATMDRLAEARAALQEESDRLEALRRDQSDEKAKLEAVRRERAVLLVKLKRDMATKDQRLASLQSDARDLEQVIAALRNAVDEDIPEKTPFARQQGRLTWPARGTVASRFGAPRAEGKLRWEGVLIRAGQGQEVRSVARGRIAFADWLRGYGLLVVIDHGDGFMSLYGHNQSLFKETGDWVDTNEIIATVGDSGGQETDALYFEIRHNGKPLDPARWCRRKA